MLNLNSSTVWAPDVNCANSLLCLFLPQILFTGGHLLQQIGDVVQGAHHVGAATH